MQYAMVLIYLVQLLFCLISCWDDDSTEDFLRTYARLGHEKYWSRARLLKRAELSFSNSGLSDPDDWKSSEHLYPFFHNGPKVTAETFEGSIKFFSKELDECKKIAEIMTKLEGCIECTYYASGSYITFAFKGKKFPYTKISSIITKEGNIATKVPDEESLKPYDYNLVKTTPIIDAKRR